MPSLIWLIGIAALAVGIAMGWLLHVRRIGHREQVDWRTRVAARDRDLHDLREQLTRVTIELQEANARRGATDELGILEADLAAQRSRAAAAEARLSAAEVELADVRDLEIGGGASSDTDLLHRIEELEVELTALASHRCPDPGAHSSGDIGRVRPRRGTTPTPATTDDPTAPVEGADPGAPDDLTLVAGISIGLAKLLRTMGIASFEDLSAIDDATVDRLDALVGGVRDRFERNTWAEAARDLHARKLAAAS